MRTFIKQSLCLFLFIATFLSYSNAFAETGETVEADAQDSIDWPGVYHGFIPCADCTGVKTTLALNTNHTYLLISQYVGKSEKEIVEKGKFTWGSKSNTLVLTPRKSTQIRSYFVGENTLTQLDDNGNRITGKLAERYVLRRNEVNQAKSPSMHH